MYVDYIIQPEDKGNWSLWIGSERVIMGAHFGCGLVTAAHVGLRVWRAAGVWFLESSDARKAREEAENILAFDF